MIYPIFLDINRYPISKWNRWVVNYQPESILIQQSSPPKTPLRGWDGVPEVNTILNSSNWIQPLQIMKKTGPKYPSASTIHYAQLMFHETYNSSFLAPAWTGKDQQQIGRHWLVTCQFHKGSNLNFWPPQRRHLRVSRSTRIHWSLPQMENQHLMHQECQTAVLETDYFLPTFKELDASKGIRALCSCKDLARLIVHLSASAVYFIGNTKNCSTRKVKYSNLWCPKWFFHVFFPGPYQIPCHGPLRYQRIVLLTRCPTIVPPTFQVLRGCLIFFWKCWSWSRVEASKFRCYTYTLLSFAGIHVTPFDPHSLSIKAELKSYRPTIGRQKSRLRFNLP